MPKKENTTIDKKIKKLSEDGVCWIKIKKELNVSLNYIRKTLGSKNKNSLNQYS